MNSKQTKVIQTVTDSSWINRYVSRYIDGNLTFSVMEIGDKVIVHGSNTDSISWFQKQFIVQITVGTRGGINKIVIH
jgi:hypothetical protein